MHPVCWYRVFYRTCLTNEVHFKSGLRFLLFSEEKP